LNFEGFASRRWLQGVAVVLALSANAGEVAARDGDFQKDCPPAFDFGPLLMDDAAADAPIPIEVLRCETFVRAQWTVLSDGADALQAMSARIAQGGDQLGVIEANRRRITTLIAGKQRRREELLGEPAESREPQLSQLTEEIAALSREVDALNEQILREFPAYGELSAPSAVDIRQLRSLMRDDEVVVQILVNDDAAYIWAVSRDRIEWRRAPDFGAEKMNAAVTALRRGLEVADVTRDYDPLAQEQAQSDLANPPSGEPALQAVPFDRLQAHKLYSDLFGQVEGTLAGGKTLIVVVNGALSAIPLGILVTEPPQGDDRNPDDLRATHWLSDQYTLVSLPSLSALRSLRCFERGGDSARRPEGCPELSPAGAASLAVSDAEPLSFFGVGNPVLGGVSTRADRAPAPPPVAAAFTGRLANVDLLRSLSPLPGTGRELQAISSQFTSRGKGSVILTADDAREPRILERVTDSATGVRTNPDLARARYVSFSTHGLLTGQGGENAEPGLVLTPPATASEADDGLLSASEAAQLTLRAEFVVLSACNTAASDGSVGAEGLAGLGPAFFYAGARSLLVSHWEVSDEATAELMSGTFAELDKEGSGVAGEGRAAAFQRSMRAVRNSPAHREWAHPSFWAAFSFIGDPG
jgi:CHAT domain-containing protein